MVIYQCEKCKAIFNKMSNYKRHRNRKSSCGLINNNNEVEPDVKNEKKSVQDCAGIVQDCAEMCFSTFVELSNQDIGGTKQDLKNSINLNIKTNEKLENINQELFCQYCMKKYSSKSTLVRHLKNNCKIKKDKDIEKENIFKLLLEKDKKKEQEINELKKQNVLISKQNQALMDKLDMLMCIDKNGFSNFTQNINTTNNINSNNINSNNTQNNIVMINFGNEDLNLIDKKEFIDRVVKKQISGVKIPEEILKIIHFNPQYPQLSNIYISDINREKFMIYENGEWVLTHIDKIPQIMDKIVLFSNDAEEELRNLHPNNKRLNERLDTIKKYNNMIDDDYIQELRDDEYVDRCNEIKRCEEFKKHAYNTLKLTLYNEGKKIKKLKN